MNGAAASPIGYDHRRGAHPVRLDAAVVSPLAGGGSLYRLAIAVGSAFVGNDLHIFSVATDANGEAQISNIRPSTSKTPRVGTPPAVTLGIVEGSRMPVGAATAVPVTITTGASGTAPGNPVALDPVHGQRQGGHRFQRVAQRL